MPAIGDKYGHLPLYIMMGPRVLFALIQQTEEMYGHKLDFPIPESLLCHKQWKLKLRKTVSIFNAL